jgi:hypothetical protein
MTYLKGLTEAELVALDKEATAYLLEQTKYIAPEGHPILGVSLINLKTLPKEYGKNKQNCNEKEDG